MNSNTLAAVTMTLAFFTLALYNGEPDLHGQLIKHLEPEQAQIVDQPAPPLEPPKLTPPEEKIFRPPAAESQPVRSAFIFDDGLPDNDTEPGPWNDYEVRL